MANAALKEMRYAFTRVRAVPLRAQGRDLRLGAHAPRRSALRADRRARPRARRRRLDGDHRRRARDHGGRHRRRGRREQLRREHPAAVRGRDHAVPRRRPEARQLPLLLHPQGHVREGGARVRAAARRLRHARRGVRAAHARADRQVAARADRAARRSRRHLLAELDAVRASASCATAATSRPRTSARAITDDVRVALAEITGFYRNYHSLRFVDGDLVLRMQHAPVARAGRRRSTPSSPTSSRAARSSRPRRARPRSPTTTFPSLPRLRMRFDRRSYSRLRELIDGLNEPE